MLYREKAVIYQPNRRASKEANPTGTLILDFQPLVLREDKCLLFKPTSLWYFVMAAQLTNTMPKPKHVMETPGWTGWSSLDLPSLSG